MNINNLNSRLKEIKIEEIIWYIYIGIIFLSFYSNNLEKEYFLNKNDNAKNKYHNIMMFIFFILLFVYYYFFKSSYDDLKNLNRNNSFKKRTLVSGSFVASSLILISGIIFFIISIFDEDIDVELAFS